MLEMLLALGFSAATSSTDDSIWRANSMFIRGCELSLQSSQGDAADDAIQLALAVDCDSYVKGVTDAIAAAGRFQADQGSICVPADADANRVLRRVVANATDTPEMLSMGGRRGLVLLALIQLYPCE